MKLITFQILLISLPFSWSARYCAVTKFEPKTFFDTDNEQMGHQNISYKENNRQDDACFVSFHVAGLRKLMLLDHVTQCATHFAGEAHVVAGQLTGYKHTKKVKEIGCYYQHNWVFCVCDHNYCNSPQYWSLLLGRFYHRGYEDRTELIAEAQDFATTILAANYHFTVQIETSTTIYPDHLRCLMWYADTVGQEEFNAPFYLFNYITERHDAPSVDAFADPRPKKPTDSLKPQTYYYEEQQEPFLVEQVDKKNGAAARAVAQQDGKYSTISLIVGGASAVLFLVSFGITFVLLNKFCKGLQDQSNFSRKQDVLSRNRFEALFFAENVPKEFVKLTKGEKKSDKNEKKEEGKKEEKKDEKKEEQVIE